MSKNTHPCCTEYPQVADVDACSRVLCSDQMQRAHARISVIGYIELLMQSWTSVGAYFGRVSAAGAVNKISFQDRFCPELISEDTGSSLFSVFLSNHSKMRR